MPATRSRIRETAISLMIVVILAIGVVWSLPASAIRNAVSPILAPIGLAAGLDQDWSLFAPTPPVRQENVEVHVAMASGKDEVWTLPTSNPIFGAPLTHRWRKFKEELAHPTADPAGLRPLGGPGVDRAGRSRRPRRHAFASRGPSAAGAHTGRGRRRWRRCTAKI